MRDIPPLLPPTKGPGLAHDALFFAQRKDLPKPPSRSGLTARKMQEQRAAPSMPADSFMMAHIKRTQAARPRGGYHNSGSPGHMNGSIYQPVSGTHVGADSYLINHIKTAPKASAPGGGAMGQGRIDKVGGSSDFLQRLEAAEARDDVASRPAASEPAAPPAPAPAPAPAAPPDVAAPPAAAAAPPAVPPAGKSKWRSLKNTSKAASAFGKRKGKAPAPAAG